MTSALDTVPATVPAFTEALIALIGRTLSAGGMTVREYESMERLRDALRTYLEGDNES